jgi:hypothetical protein
VGGLAGQLEVGTTYFIRCVDAAGQRVNLSGDPNRPERQWTYQPGGPGPLDELPVFEVTAAVEAFARTSVVPPVVAISPPGTQLVGVPTWFWVTSAWESNQATTPPLANTGVTATIRARARTDGSAMVFDPKNGDRPVACKPPGIAWDGQRDDASDCRYTFQDRVPPGHKATLSITYDLEWWVNETANPIYAGLGGTLPSLTGTAEVPIAVKGTQAVGSG